MESINGFTGEYFFLHNDFNISVIHEGIRYTNAESAYQATKCANILDRFKFARMSGRKAKKHIKKVSLLPDYESKRYERMLEVVRLKFDQHPYLVDKLLETGERELINHSFVDSFWGIDSFTGVGENNLGKILMRLREEFSNKRQGLEPVQVVFKSKQGI